jgi:CheY-like chemotaxis protein
MNDLTEFEILLVEDNPNDAELAMRGLAKKNLANKVIWVTDGEEALDFVFSTGKHAGRGNNLPKLILLDLKLPKIDGTEVLRRIRSDARTKYIPVVMMTSSAEEGDILNSYDLGANSYVVKPVEFGKFVDVVANAGLYWAVVNKSAT